MKEKLTTKEILAFALVYFNKLDKNGGIADTRGNRIRYRMFCKLAGGEDKRDEFCKQIGEKVTKLQNK